jgi:hypothetical protein
LHAEIIDMQVVALGCQRLLCHRILLFSYSGLY